jgi:lysozyme family protein
MNSNFSACWAFTAQQEGGYTSNPADPGNWTGGACGVGTCAGTNYGISAAAYPNLNIKALTLVKAGAYMEWDYWNKVAGDSLPVGIDLVVFDAAVNLGVTAAAKILQGVVGVAQDGVIWRTTLAAVASMPAASVIAAFTAARVAYYEGLSTFGTFGDGWITRAHACQAAALGMVA